MSVIFENYNFNITSTLITDHALLVFMDFDQYKIITLLKLQ